MTTQIVPARLGRVARERLCFEGAPSRKGYPRASAVALTCDLVSGLIAGWSSRTRETVAIETPAAAATSASLGLPLPFEAFAICHSAPCSSRANLSAVCSGSRLHEFQQSANRTRFWSCEIGSMQGPSSSIRLRPNCSRLDWIANIQAIAIQFGNLPSLLSRGSFGQVPILDTRSQADHPPFGLMISSAIIKRSPRAKGITECHMFDGKVAIMPGFGAMVW